MSKTYELTLHGSISHTKLPKLIDRLVGICGDMRSPPDQLFCDHTIVYIPSSSIHIK